MDLRYLSNPSSSLDRLSLQQHYLPGHLTCTVGASWAPSWKCQQWKAWYLKGCLQWPPRIRIWVEHRWFILQLAVFLYGYVDIIQKSDMICCDDPVHHFLSLFKSLTSFIRPLHCMLLLALAQFFDALHLGHKNTGWVPIVPQTIRNWSSFSGSH